jgi:hypothetical protein
VRDWKGKVVVVTGAASGIGQALARQLSEKGAVLALVDVDPVGLEKLAGELRGSGDAGLSTHVVDVSDRVRMQALPADVIDAHGVVDVLINNAGVSVGAMFADHDIEDAEWLLGINVYGVIYGCKFFLPHLLERPEAHIVNLSSMFGIFAMPGQAMYSASKAAVRAFTEALWTELDGTSVRLTTVHPGGIKTNVIRSSRMLDDEAKQKAVSLQDRFGMPVEKCAAAILRAVEADRRRVLVGIDAKLGSLLKRLFPVGFQRLLTLAFRIGRRGA